MRPCRPSVLVALAGVATLTALTSSPAFAKPPILSPLQQDLAAVVSPDGATMPLEFSAAAPISVREALARNPGFLAGSPRLPAGGERGGCAELVDVNGPVDGDMPREVAFLPDGSTAVIVNRDTNNVTYLDLATNTITGATPVGEFPVFVTVTPNGQYILTANVMGNSVTVIDAATRQVVATVPVTGAEPYRIAVTSDSARAVVGVINNASNATFSVIDLATMSEVSTFPGGTQGVYGGFANSVFPIFGNIFGTFALAPDDQTVVLPASGVPTNQSTVFFFDINTGAQTNAVVGPTGARPVDISADGTMAAVGYLFASRQIDIFDMATQSVASTINTTTNIDAHLRFTPDASRLVTGYLNDTFIIDRVSGTEIFRTGTGAVGDIEITHDGLYAIVANFTTRLINLATPAVTAAMSYAATNEMAVSPVSHRAVGLNNRFGEDAHVYRTDGPSSAFLAGMLSGPTPEGDAPFDVDISADGQTAIVGLTLSYNVAIVDVPSRTVRAHVNTGKRVMDVAITPNGAYAVTCDGDSDRVSIIDLATDTVVRQLSVPQRPAQVRISPDSSTAYVLTIAGTDRIAFINLAGAASSLVGSVPAGQTGSWGGPMYSENSSIELSPDGSLLAVCDSFNDNLLLIDTATRTLVASVPVNDFPIRMVFSPDGTRAYTTNPFSHDMSVVNVAGAGSSLITNVPIGNNAFTIAIDATGSYVYVTSHHFLNGSTLYIVDTASLSVVHSIPLDGRNARDSHYDAASNTLFIATVASSSAGSTPALYRFDAAGPATTLIDVTPLSGNTYDMAYSAASGVLIASQPWLDAVELFCFGGGPECPADWNGDGLVNSGDITAFLTAWLGSIQDGTLVGDFNGDGLVNSGDITAFLTAWLDAVGQGGC